ncbi:MAG: hypothetical protein EA401_03695 [Planctomycetota bacterium]|nr:MAG: hypothetical protein EA401_03695 [Planctomycetota bacterium]
MQPRFTPESAITDMNSSKHTTDHNHDTPGDSDAAAAEQAQILREQITAELHQQLALERFQKEQPELWLQASRLGALMELQEQCQDAHFPPGSCFLYAAVPVYQCFPLRRILNVDLDTCQTQLEIYGDGDLEEGTVTLPLEAISWHGFPKDAIPLHFPYSGFTTSRPL